MISPPNSIDHTFSGVDESRTFRHLLKTYRLSEKKVLDIGCGNGQFLVQFGRGSVGITTTPQEVDFGKEHNIDIRMGNAERLSTNDFEHDFDAFWANNLFEHLLSPHAFLMNLKKFASREALLILGVPVIPVVASLTHTSKFRGALASPHINFFTRKTLLLTVERAGWRVLDARSFFFSNPLCDRMLTPITPHVYVVAQNDSNFEYPRKKVIEWAGDEYYRSLLEITKQS